MYPKHQYGADSYAGGAAESSRSSNNDQLTEKERQFQDDLDSMCIVADNNTWRPMVEKVARDSSGHLTYKCIPCGIFSTGEAALKDHLYSGLHKSSQLKGLQENYSIDECEARLRLYRSLPCTIQSLLDDSSEPMVGIEYIVELSHGDNQTPDIYCALCLKWIQNKNILKHLQALPHNFTYVQRHYPKAYFLYLEQTNFGVSHLYNKKIVIKKIINCIGNTYRRQKPLRIFAPEFASNRELICKWIHGSHHYNDSNGSTFEDVTEELIAKLKKSGQEKCEDKETEDRSTTSTKKENKVKILEDKKNIAMELVKKAEAKAKETMLSHEKKPEMHPLYPAEWKKFWNKRYKEIKAEGKDTKTYDYKSEWIIFWKDRSKELYEEELRLATKKIYRKMSLPIPKELDDPPGDNVRLNKNKEKRISPEKPSDKSDLRFIINKCRAKDRKSAERGRSTERHRSLDRRKFNEKRRSPEKRRLSGRSRRTEKRSSLNRKYSRSPSRARPTKRRRSSERSSTRSSHHRDSHRKSMDRPKRLRSRSRSSTRGKAQIITINSSSPNSDNESMASLTDDVKYETMNKDDEHENVNIYSWQSESDESLDSLHDVKSLERSPEAVARSSSRSTNNTPVCNSVHVLPILRLLVALEDHLGSLGPKVVDLLTEALKLEKEKANSSEQLLDRDSCLTLLETVNEKLKGASQAGLISGSATTAVRTAMVRITALIHEADRRAAASNKTVTKVETDENQKTKVNEVEETNPMDHSLTEEPSPPNMSLDTTDNESPEPEKVVMPHPMGDLSDVDLVTLLYDFVKLNEEEQDGLIGYLKILETQDPCRVKKLRNHPPPAPTKPPPQKRLIIRNEASQSVTQNPKSPINVSNLLATVRATVEPSPVFKQLASSPTATAILVDTGVIPKLYDTISPINNAMNFPTQNQSYNCNPTQNIQFTFTNQPSIPDNLGMDQQPVFNNCPENLSYSQSPYYESNANNSFTPDTVLWGNQNTNFDNSLGSGNYCEPQPGNMPNAPYNMPNAQYNMPNAPYNMPNAPYNMPNAQYNMPNAPYNMPNEPYNMPNAPYNMPNAPYNMPNEPYNMPNEPHNMPNRPFFGPNKFQNNTRPPFVSFNRGYKRGKKFNYRGK